jgi:hypothetical protein
MSALDKSDISQCALPHQFGLAKIYTESERRAELFTRSANNAIVRVFVLNILVSLCRETSDMLTNSATLAQAETVATIRARFSTTASLRNGLHWRGYIAAI